MEEIRCIDVKNSCRTCLLSSEGLESLFEISFEDVMMSKMLNQITLIEIYESDGLGDKVCRDCRLRIIDSFKFQQLCLRSDRSIRMAIENLIPKDNEEKQQISHIIKTECVNNDDNDNDPDVKVNTAPNISEDTLDELDQSNAILIAELQPLIQEFESETDISHSQQEANSEDSSEEEDDDDGDNSNKMYQCESCSKIFKKPSLLQRHAKIHDPNRRPWECPKCQKRFQSQVALVRHDIIHSDIVQRSQIARTEGQIFNCVVCKRSLKSPESLSAHLKAHKSKSPEKQEYTCKLCHDVFPKFSDILKHSKNHIENATHQCIICNKLVSVGDELIDHFLRHRGLKPHSCNICQKSFLKLHKLNVHMRTHSDDKVVFFAIPFSVSTLIFIISSSLFYARNVAHPYRLTRT